jgi:hypothetical protein
MTAWREVIPGPVRNEEEFVAFLDAVGLCLWLPLPRPDFPNLAEMMEIRPQDVMGHTWFWKDDLHAAKQLYYGKLFGGNAGFVSMAFLPSVIAARGDIDPHTLHEQGRLSDSALRVYEALMKRRALPTRDLRREAGLAASGERTAFENAAVALTGLFQICKVDITGRTRGTYSYVWGLVEDWIPETLSAASRLRPHAAARTVAARLAGMGVRLEERHWKRLFGWDDETVAAAQAAGFG